jgi:hypothetical protein
MLSAIVAPAVCFASPKACPACPGGHRFGAALRRPGSVAEGLRGDGGPTERHAHAGLVGLRRPGGRQPVRRLRHLRGFVPVRADFPG